MSETWQQVVVEKDPSTMVPPDVANVGPAPRQLSPALKKHLSLMSPSWDKWLVFFAAGTVAVGIMAIATAKSLSVGSVLSNVVWAGALCAGAFFAYKRNSKIRNALKSALSDAPLRFARLLENRQTEIRQGRRTIYRYDAVFEVDGVRVPYRTYNEGMSMINRGQLIEVLFNPAQPDMIVPTFLLV